VIGCLLHTKFRGLRHFWLELRPPRYELAGKPHFRFAPDCFGQMRPKRRHDRFGAMSVAPAVRPFSIKIVRMVGDTRHLAASPSLTLSSVPEGHRISGGDELGAQFNFGACAGDVTAQLVVDLTRLGPLRRPRTDDRVPEERTKKSNYNNAKDEASRVGTKDLVVRGGQPVGIAHAKLLGRPPASQRHQTLIKIS
jgi:hypothetical protein